MRLVLLLIVYVLAGRLGLHFAFVNASATALWPPTGIAIASVLLFGPRVWPAIFVGAFVVNILTAGSVATSLAVFWGERLGALGASGSRMGSRERDPSQTWQEVVAANVSSDVALQALDQAVDRLARDFGRWRTPWGEINRFQRLPGDIVHPFDDSRPSIPVGFTHGNWGSLASFAAAPRNGTKKWYGTSGNSFVAVVELGDSVRAIAVTAGGESGHPASPHFNDEAQRYATGNLREVYFYPSQLQGHIEKVYHPGER